MKIFSLGIKPRRPAHRRLRQRPKSDYRAPQVNYPTSWQHAAENAAPTPFDWRDFHDPELDRWLHQVMASNNDLAAAVLRLYRARLRG